MDQAPVRWRKSSRSATTGGECVEVAVVRGGVSPGNGPVYLMRDSKRGHGPVLAVAAGAWAAFVRGVKAGQITG
ncbi:DUF397 domain-containing protein [Sphaerisporangium sp. B11E5]|uniref:DUF397 domain-containing protein n=1 Tax=Sphaerisporangium sp. B11E5 TaxID=3153563 RepID=UPI00325DB00E